jgi:hypothetical protein
MRTGIKRERLPTPIIILGVVKLALYFSTVKQLSV